METNLVIEIMYEPQHNLEEKDAPSILKDDFSSRIQIQVQQPSRVFATDQMSSHT